MTIHLLKSIHLCLMDLKVYLQKMLEMVVLTPFSEILQLSDFPKLEAPSTSQIFKCVVIGKT